MDKNKNEGRMIGAGVLSAVAASFCCITPILAIISGTTGITALFTWIEPFRPLLIGISIAMLGLCWFLKLRPVKNDDCNCEIPVKKNFFHSILFLVLMTATSIILILFPYFSNAVFKRENKTVLVANTRHRQLAEFSIRGMSCASCQNEVKYALNKLPGIIQIDVHYEKGNAIVAYDTSRVNSNSIAAAINTTGYRVYKSIIR